jgi:uroporphyrin-III C-methyltransferase/precorrin-2 dehydrogenase/sirohydrochlorin ferrochelatase
MRYFPLFADLRGRRVLVVGGGDIAERKVRLLRESGAGVDLVAREIVAAELAAWIAAHTVSWLAHEFDESQLEGVTLVIAATDDAALNDRVATAARARHLLCNVVDDAERSGFIVPAIVDRSPLVIAISSGGVAPVLARWVRERMAATYQAGTA